MAMRSFTLAPYDTKTRANRGLIEAEDYDQKAGFRKCHASVSSNEPLLGWLRGGVVIFALLAGGGFAVPGAVGAQGRGTVETVLVVDAIGRIKLCVLQPRDEPLILVPELPSHQSGLSHHHHILQGTGRGANIIPATRGCSVGDAVAFYTEVDLHYSARYTTLAPKSWSPAQFTSHRNLNRACVKRLSSVIGEQCGTLNSEKISGGHPGSLSAARVYSTSGLK